jgi:Bacterial Ig-like domain (group 3)/FG-GAP-like repeat
MHLLAKGPRLDVCLLVLLAIVSLAASAGAERLQSPPLILTGSDPRTLAVGDFNADGKQDLAYLDGSSPSLLHILLGNGDGTFQHGSDIVLPLGIGGAITIADVNNDGHQDLLIGGGNQFQAEVAVLLGQGNGSFSAPIISQFASNTASFADIPFTFGVADFNGDGAADLIVTDPQNGLIYCLLGNNTGSFVLKSTFGDGGGPGQVLTADFNGDGHPDFLVQDRLGADVAVFLGLGDGTFQPGVSYTGPNHIGSVVLADMDGDGHLDMVIGGFSNIISILRGNPDGTFATTSSGDTTVAGPLFFLVAVTDLNGDGISDAVITSGNGIGILPGQGSFKFGPVTNFVGGNSTVFADFNSDAHTDFAVPVHDGIVLLLGNPDGSLQSIDTYSVPNGAASVAIADFNADGFLDIAADGPPQNPSILLGNGLGKFSPGPAPAPGGISGPLIFTGDFNGDGKADLLVAGVSSSSAVLYGNGNATFSAPIPLPRSVIGFSGSALGDFNADGATDVVATNFESLDVFLGHTNNTFTVLTSIIPSISAPDAPAVGDFNKDGKLDLVYNDISGLQILLGNGDGTFRGGRILPAGGALAVADFDGDGNLDIVAAGTDQFTPGSSQFTVFFGNGDGTFQPGLVFPLSLKFLDQIVVADMDGDGRPDLLMTDENQIIVVHYVGGRSFGPEVHYAAGAISQFTVRDLNHDGLPDLVVANGNVSVLLNQAGQSAPTGTFTISSEPSAFGQPFTVTLTLNSPTAAGSVIFSADGTPIANVPVSAGVATFTLADSSSLALGLHAFAAFYSGDTSFTPAVFPLQHKVVPVIHPTTVTLTASPVTVLLSQTVHFAVTVTSAGPTPRGIVAIHDGSVNIGSVTLDPLTGKGIFDTALLSAGTHVVTAVYQGDANSAPGTSTPVSIVVNGITTTTSLAALPAAPQAGSTFALTATVSSPLGSPFGQVAFFDGTALLGTRALDSSSVAILTSTFSNPGTHSFSAVYRANGPFLGSTSTPLNLSPVSGAAPSNAVLSATSDPAGARLLLTANLHPAISGRVQFFVGFTPLGEAAASQSGTATLQMSGVFPGSHYFTAVFPGSSDFSNSAATLLVASPAPSGPDFAVHLSTATATVSSSHPASLNMQIDPIDGFADDLALSCSTSAGMSCSLSPASLKGGGNSVVTLSLPSPSAAVHTTLLPAGLLGLAVAACLLLSLSACFYRRPVLAVLGCFCLLAAAGCGGRIASSASQATSATVTLTATSTRAPASLSHSVEIEVVIAPPN